MFYLRIDVDVLSPFLTLIVGVIFSFIFIHAFVVKERLSRERIAKTQKKAKKA